MLCLPVGITEDVKELILEILSLLSINFKTGRGLNASYEIRMMT
jgi:hypothetical protein